MSDSSSSEGEEEVLIVNPKKKTTKNDVQDEIEQEEPEDQRTFEELGLHPSLVAACERLGWTKPSKIQAASLPHALAGRDLIGLAETGSGKTAAFALPILQSLLDRPQAFFGLVLVPTRELAYQVAQTFEALGSGIGLIVAVIVGGIDTAAQAIALAKRPHVIVATPGRLCDHLQNTKGFSLKALKYLVLDEADRCLNMDFEEEIDKILKAIPRERRTFLFSATMTKKVGKLERASLKDPARVEVSSRYQTVRNLKQSYLFIPHKYKTSYLVSILMEHSGNTAIVFCATCNSAMETALILRNLGIQAVPIHGKLPQEKRLAALNKFIAKQRTVLVATDVAARGLDIPHVDIVVNFDVPAQSKDYVHRVGRTARAGRSGIAITFVTQYDVEQYQKIESHLGKKLEEFPVVEKEVMLLVERVQEATEVAQTEMKDSEDRKRRKKRRGDDSDDDTEEISGGFNKKLGGKNKGGKPNGVRPKKKLKR